MRFNSSRSALEPNTELFLSQIMGHLTLTITAVGCSGFR
jgi:hypothetical protein